MSYLKNARRYSFGSGHEIYLPDDAKCNDGAGCGALQECINGECVDVPLSRRPSPARSLRPPPRGPTFYSLPFPPGACGTSSGAGSTVVITKKVVVPNGPTFYNLIDSVNWIDTGRKEKGMIIARHKDGGRPLAAVPVCLEAVPKGPMTRVPNKGLNPLQRKMQRNTFKAKRRR